ncbi:uncharacterized protein N7477_003848 [Penicillium maclennaniae]|uniref:uncharacterized protein n=1 Tax=Penicillium maclennaniae TaxID=1343394 RepID=UPI002541B308|nr:uncharacterized protein N7477_003848 [Penicillium maclennaniae]KAJ5678215.1 hypothetical protein N7477_003848 [Penicillium maclennaniae]
MMDEKLSIGNGRALPPQLPHPSDYVVDFDGPEDPTHPYNWKLSANLLYQCRLCPGIDYASKEFGVSPEVGTLGTTLYVLGFSSGPMIWAPVSELQGRKWPLTIAMLGGGIFTIGSAVAKDIQTLIICRFFAGMCAASQLTVVPGVLSDVFDNRFRGVAITLYALTVFVGPFCAPFTGGFIATSYLGWRWTLYIPAILSLVNGAFSLLFLRETYAPVILVDKAFHLRRQTGNWGIHAKQEKIEVEFQEMMEKYFTRPLRMLVTEPIILCVSMYMSFIYGIVYALLEAYPYVFEEIHGMTPGIGGLPFIGLIVGQILGCGFMLSQQGAYVKRLDENKGVPVPEWRLRPTLFGAPLFTMGIFWFGWTGFTEKIHWAAPSVAGVFIGFGVICVFLPCFAYLIDAYLPLAASAVAANIILRSAVAAGFPLFAKQMFKNMGVQWAGTLLGCLAAIMIPIPFLFRSYGPLLRRRSKLFQ